MVGENRSLVLVASQFGLRILRRTTSQSGAFVLPRPLVPRGHRAAVLARRPGSQQRSNQESPAGFAAHHSPSPSNPCPRCPVSRPSALLLWSSWDCRPLDRSVRSRPRPKGSPPSPFAAPALSSNRRSSCRILQHDPSSDQARSPWKPANCSWQPLGVGLRQTSNSWPPPTPCLRFTGAETEAVPGRRRVASAWTGSFRA